MVEKCPELRMAFQLRPDSRSSVYRHLRVFPEKLERLRCLHRFRFVFRHGDLVCDTHPPIWFFLRISRHKAEVCGSPLSPHRGG